ncbi:putative ankyrin repeat protein RF_0381 [Leptopilina heterotoma]|uniref:putative ankyrin repeat protein RF_0381 n=1 Tax=Leptopilina heterotoma TaxID=63436 RepID=UPI001CA929F8|nr:putative ankyrin repeat protein RF_0381 [Leptopilina heterotoma]XP_043479808.1 putative ankyrin repeat protein RF_0381 [Leptopilina heterotoma]
MSSEDYYDWDPPYESDDDYNSHSSYESDDDYNYENDFPAMDTPLYHAVFNGDFNLFLHLFDKISPKERERKCSLMHTAAAKGHSEIVTILCERNFPINEGDPSGDTPLHLAISNNHPSVFDILVKKSNLNATNIYGETPLHLATEGNHIQLVKILLENGANVNEQTRRGSTPLHLALIKKHIELTEILLQNGADVNIQQIQDMTPFHLAISGNHIQLVEKFLQNGANVNLQLEDGTSSLHITVENKYIQLTRILLQHGADVNVQDNNKKSPLHIAIIKNCIQLAEILLKNGADVHVIDRCEETPLDLTVKYNNIELVELLLKNEATISEENKKDKRTHEIMITPLRYALNWSNYKIVKLLIMNGFNAIDVQNYSGKTVLHLSVINNDYDMFKYLVEHGSKIDAKSNAWVKDECDNKYLSFQYETILEFALSSGNLKILRYLLKNSSLIDASPYSALHLAVREGQVEVVKEMVKQNDLDKNSIDSRLAVYIAVENEREDILKILLDAGYSSKTCFKDRSPLHVAATFNHTRLVEMLLNAGADLNSMTEKSVTCLHFAAAAGQSTVVKFLLEAGIHTTNCELALEYTLRRGIDDDKLWILSPFMYKNISNITEMLLIVEISKTKDPYQLWNKLSDSANKITVSEQSEQESSLNLLQTEEFISNKIEFEETTKFGEYGTEFLMCFLNYLSNFQMGSFLTSMIQTLNYLVLRPEFIHMLLEYNDYISNFYEDDIILYSEFKNYNMNLLLIGHIENVYCFNDICVQRNLVIDKKLKNDSTDLSKLLAARLFIISRNSSLKDDLEFYKKHNLIEWRDECEREVKLMKETEIANNCRVTFYDILTQSVNKVANYTRNDNLLQNVESSYMQFPAYVEFLKLSIEKGKRRRDLLDKFVNSMLNLIKKNNRIQLSTIEINQIFQYLSVVDMRRLLSALS